MSENNILLARAVAAQSKKSLPKLKLVSLVHIFLFSTHILNRNQSYQRTFSGLSK